MLNHEQLLEEWKKDAHIDPTKLMEAMFELPKLHAKYISYLVEYKISVKKKLKQFEQLKLLKTRYYNGEMNKEELDQYNWPQYKFNKPLKSQMDSLLDADSDLQKMVEQVEYLKILIDTAESILKSIHSNTYLVRTILDNRRFEAGV